MNLYFLNSGDGLLSYVKEATGLTSMFRDIYRCDSEKQLYPELIRHSSSDCFLLILSGSAKAHAIIRRVHDFLPQAAFLCVCENVSEISEGKLSLSDIPNVFHTMPHLSMIPPVGLLSYLHQKLNGEITIPNARYLLKYENNEILYLESERHRVKIHTFHHVDTVYSKLSDISRYLGPHYIRCHQSYIVNRNFISKIEGSNCILCDRIPIPISRAYLGLIKTVVLRDSFTPLLAMETGKRMLRENAAEYNTKKETGKPYSEIP